MLKILSTTYLSDRSNANDEGFIIPIANQQNILSYIL